MGSFSYLCSGCGRPVNSDAYSGQVCHIYLFNRHGKLVEKMYGQYDSYGCVLGEGEESLEWARPWHKIAFSDWAYYHDRCNPKKLEDVRLSEVDPNQGSNWYKKPTGKIKPRHEILIPADDPIPCRVTGYGHRPKSNNPINIPWD